MKTELQGYTLWYDGSISVTQKQLEKLLMENIVNLDDVFVSEITDDIKKFNLYSDHKLTVKTENSFDDPRYIIPSEYLEFDFDEFIFTELKSKIEHDELYDTRITRLETEYELYKKANLIIILRVLKYILDEFRKQNIFWGVGRGSSCSSYLLYLMDLHCVDVVKYNISITDFLR